MFENLLTKLLRTVSQRGKWSLIAIMLAPFFVLAAFGIIRTYRDSTEQTYSRRATVAFLAARVLQERFGNLINLARSLATRVNFQKLIAQGRWHQAADILRSVPANFAFIDRLFLTDVTGTLMADIPEFKAVHGQNFSHRDWFKGVSGNWQPYVSKAYRRSAQPAHNVIAVAIPIHSESLGRLGILVMQVRLDVILDWAKSLNLEQGGFVYFVDHGGQITAHPSHAPNASIVDYSSVPTVQHVLAGNSGVHIAYNAIEEIEELAAYEPVRGFGWGAVVSEDTNSAFARRNSNLRSLTAVYALLFLVNLGLAVLVARLLHDRSLAADELRTAKASFENIVNKTSDGIFVTDSNNIVRFLNPAAKEILGASGNDAVGKLLPFAVGTDGLTTIHMPRENETKGVGEVWRHATEWNGQPAHLISLRDVTERTNLEEKLFQSQKLEAIGRLAGGVAHDFNNALAVIIGTTDILLEELKPGNPLREDVQEAQKAAHHSVDLIKQLLAFSRRQVLELHPVQVNTVVTNTISMLQRVIGENIQIRLNLQPDLGWISADPGKLEQIFVNLIVNAKDAMPGGGKITIETANVTLGEEYVQSHPGAQEGPHVMFVVTDTGCGMTEETRKRIFEPFFTTKPQGSGTGLGLSTVFGIVKQLRGNIWVYSEVGVGTTFKIYLPQTEMPRSETVERKVPAPSTSASARTILIVEDDALVRGVIRRLLHRAGFQILEAQNAIEALQIFEVDGPSVDLMLTDVVMPQMNGPELATRIQTKVPNLRVLYMSGYTEHAILDHGIVKAGIHFIEKPFESSALIEKIWVVLNDVPPEPRA